MSCPCQVQCHRFLWGTRGVLPAGVIKAPSCQEMSDEEEDGEDEASFFGYLHVSRALFRVPMLIRQWVQASHDPRVKLC